MSDAAFEAMFVSEYPSVLRTVIAMVGDRQRAEDVCQEAFYRTFVHWRRVSSYDRPGAYVRKIAIRIAGRTSRHTVAEVPDEGALDQPGFDVDVWTAILTLPHSQRCAVVLHYLEDLRVEDCAAIMGSSSGTVKKHLYRARQRLAELLGEEDPFDVAR